MKTLISKILFVVLSLIGILDSIYLTYEKFAGKIPICGAGFDCGKVLNSSYANIFGVPLSLFGLFYYLTIFILAIMFFLDFDFGKFISNKLKLKKFRITTIELLFLLSSFGLIFSIYLVSIMAFVLKSWCPYCLVSAFTSTTIFLTSVFTLNTQKNSPHFIKTIWFELFHFFYTKILKNMFFYFDPETMHDMHSNLGRTLGNNFCTKKLTSLAFAFEDEKLNKTIDGINFKNPVGLSAGFDYNGDLTQILPSVGFGFHTIGTVTLEPYQGNTKPRLARFPDSKSLLVNKGLKSAGAIKIIEKLEKLNFKIPTGISIASTNKHFKNEDAQIKEILETFLRFELSKVQHQYYELNISCPNTFGGEPFTTKDKLERLLKALDKLKIKKPIYIKMPIDQSEKETLELLKVIDKHNIKGVIFGNLTKNHSNPKVTLEDRKRWDNMKGNLSGKPTWELSNNLISLTKKHYKNRFTIIGVGGIFSGEDAIHKLKLGADLVQLITGMIYEGPQLIGQINNKIAD